MDLGDKMIKNIGKFLVIAAMLVSGNAFAVLPNIFATQPSGNVQAALLDNNFTFVENQGVQGFATTGSSNAYIATPADAWATGYSSYKGRALTVVPNFTNTTAATVNVSGLGSATIYKNILGVQTALASGDMVSGTPAILICDGIGFLLANPTPPASASTAMVLLGSQTISSSTASISDTTHLTNAYSHYTWECSNITSTSGSVDAYLTVKQSGSFVGGTSYVDNIIRIQGGTSNVNQETGAAQFNVTAAGTPIGATNPSTVKIDFWNPATVLPLNVLVWTMGTNGTSNPEMTFGGGTLYTNAATTGVKLTLSANNFATALCNLYGIQ